MKLLPIILLIMFTLNISCNKAKDITQDIIVPNWLNGEKLTYAIMRDDTMIGRMNYSIFFDTDGDVPIFSLEMLTQTESEDDYIWDSSIVHFRRDNFAPIWSLRNIETDFGYNTVETHYDGSDIEIWLETIDGRESYNFSLREPYFEYEMLYTLFRAVRFNKTKNYKINVLQPLSLQLLPYSIRYRGKTTITTPAGSFVCDWLNLTSIGKKINVYYEIQEPRRLIRYQEKNSPISVVLING